MGALASFAETEKLGSRRNLLLVGVDDLKPAADANPIPILTREQAFSLQEELGKGFADDEFQRKLTELEKTHGRQSNIFLRERQQLALTVQSSVLPKYGFEGNSKGVMNMMQSFRAFDTDDEFQSKGAVLGSLLRLDSPGQPQDSP